MQSDPRIQQNSLLHSHPVFWTAHGCDLKALYWCLIIIYLFKGHGQMSQMDYCFHDLHHHPDKWYQVHMTSSYRNKGQGKANTSIRSHVVYLATPHPPNLTCPKLNFISPCCRQKVTLWPLPYVCVSMLLHRVRQTGEFILIITVCVCLFIWNCPQCSPGG